MQKSKSDSEIIECAMSFFRNCEDATSENRSLALDDLRFRDGQQWPSEMQQSRQLEQRPCLVINKVDASITHVENQQRQQRPRIKVDPADADASKKVATVIQGMIRHIENNKSGGDLAYDTGFSAAATMGFGYWRVLAEYTRPDSFEQELYIAPIENAFSVYFDPNSVWPDGSDAEECLITDMISKSTFERQYPDKELSSAFPAGGIGDTYANWINKDEIRIAEYYYIEQTKGTLLLLSDGSSVWEDEILIRQLPPGIQVIDKRVSYKKQLHWCKLNAFEVLEKRQLPGRYIPVVPVYGKTTIIDGKRMHKGLVRNARDPAQIYNFWRTSMTESIALAPKAKWLIAEGQTEGYEHDWAFANTSAKQTLMYRQSDYAGQSAPPPQRIQPEHPPEGIMVAASAISQDLTSVLGIIDPAMRIGGNVSGKALNSERQQADNGSFHLYDNLTRSIAQTGRIILDLIPHYYNQPGRIVRIVGDDGQSSNEAINAPAPEGHPDAVNQLLNDVTVGEYMVVMDTGPGFNSRREEAVSAMVPLFGNNEKLMDAAGDVMFRNMDFPGSDVIADRLASINPLAQVDDKSPIPPAIQMKIKQGEQMLKQCQQELQAAQMQLKSRMDVEQLKQDGATQREHMKAVAAIHIEDQENTAWMHDVAVQSAAKQHDVEMRSITALNVAEITAIRDLLKTSVNNSKDMATMGIQFLKSNLQVGAKAASEEPIQEFPLDTNNDWERMQTSAPNAVQQYAQQYAQQAPTSPGNASKSAAQALQQGVQTNAPPAPLSPEATVGINGSNPKDVV